jgi:hypothetical protein
VIPGCSAFVSMLQLTRRQMQGIVPAGLLTPLRAALCRVDLMHLDMDIDMVPPFDGDVIASL